jgi:hypothetical protein
VLTDAITLTVTARIPNTKMVYLYNDLTLSVATAANAVPLGTATLPGFTHGAGNASAQRGGKRKSKKKNSESEEGRASLPAARGDADRSAGRGRRRRASGSGRRAGSRLDLDDGVLVLAASSPRTGVVAFYTEGAGERGREGKDAWSVRPAVTPRGFTVSKKKFQIRGVHFRVFFSLQTGFKYSARISIFEQGSSNK